MRRHREVRKVWLEGRVSLLTLYQRCLLQHDVDLDTRGAANGESKSWMYIGIGLMDIGIGMNSLKVLIDHRIAGEEMRK